MSNAQLKLKILDNFLSFARQTNALGTSSAYALPATFTLKMI